VAPWDTCPVSRLRCVRGLFTDIDDTLTREGAIDPPALQALHALHAAGLPVIAVTGRPMGWSQPFALQWPVAAIVAENGAVALQRDPTRPDGLRIDYAQDAATLAYNAQRLKQAASRILRELPQARLATDSAGRVTDIAIDHSEFNTLLPAEIQQVVRLMEEEGLRATVSSIHINAWFGEHSKWTGAQWMARELLGIDLAADVDRWLFVGDSTNDQAMFERFPLSVGVANLMRFADRLQIWPAYLSTGERGLGFAEVAQALLRARGQPVEVP
jgi:HAD superfamily hydrolase (TIGR01484 family)